jgi:glycosyltransferase involved in cell wall biosynthesis
MDVSIIIITRNTCALTGNAIRSVQAGGDSVSKEIIIVDNGSNDNTAAVLKHDFPSIKLIRSETNLGFARVCNLAAKQARGEFLLLLNSDARLAPDALELASAWMRAHPDCAVAGAQLLNPDGSHQNSIANFPTLATELLNKSLLLRLWPKKIPGKEQVFTAPVDVEMIVGAFVFVRKGIWDVLGGPDPHAVLVVDGRIGKLKGDLLHHSIKDLSHLVRKTLAYSDDFLRQQIETGRKVSSLDVWVRPVWRFGRGYLLRLGFLDGWQSFHAAWIGAFYTFLRYARVLEEQHKTPPVK